MSKMGAPRKDIDPEKLKNLMQFKPTLRTTAGYFDCSEDTIENRVKEIEGPDCTYSVFRDKYMAGVRISLVQKALKMALEDKNTAMMIFCLKNINKWSDNKDLKVSGETDGVVQITYQVQGKE